MVEESMSSKSFRVAFCGRYRTDTDTQTTFTTPTDCPPPALTWRRCRGSRQRCWCLWSPSCPRSWCQRAGCHGNQTSRGKRWSGTPLWRKVDLKKKLRKKGQRSLAHIFECMSVCECECVCLPACSSPSGVMVSSLAPDLISQIPATVKCIQVCSDHQYKEHEHPNNSTPYGEVENAFLDIPQEKEIQFSAKKSGLKESSRLTLTRSPD